MMSTHAAIVMHEYGDAAALADGLCAAMHAALCESMRSTDGALFALAGGRTPVAAYARFAKTVQHDSAHDASRAAPITVFPTDDRCVPHAHPASNVTVLRALFAETLVQVESLTAPDGDCTASLNGAREALARHARPFDFVLLGMGEDAHTASLFPGAAQLDEALDPAAAHDAFRVDPDPLPPDAPFARVTLGAARLLRTRALHLAITGARKREVFERAIAGGDLHATPIALLRDAPVDVHVHWSPA